MDFIKKHRIGVIVAAVIIFLVSLIFFGVKALFYSSSGTSAYGNRLDGIDDVPITNDVIDSIKANIMNTGKIETITYHLKGKIMEISIDVKSSVDLNNGKAVTDKIIEGLSDDIKKFYDVQVFLTSKSTEGETLYPVIGYKHKTRLIFSWSNTKVGGSSET